MRSSHQVQYNRGFSGRSQTVGCPAPPPPTSAARSLCAMFDQGEGGRTRRPSGGASPSPPPRRARGARARRARNSRARTRGLGGLGRALEGRTPRGENPGAMRRSRRGHEGRRPSREVAVEPPADRHLAPFPRGDGADGRSRVGFDCAAAWGDKNADGTPREALAGRRRPVGSRRLFRPGR